MADDLSAVLNLLHQSHKRWRTVRAEGEDWVDEDRNKEAFFRSVGPGSFGTTRGSPWPADRDPRWKVWARQPDQWRADFGGAHQRRFLVISDGHRVCSSSPTGGAYRVSDERVDLGTGAGPAGVLLRPVGLLAGFDLEVVDRAQVTGRKTFTVRGLPRTVTERRSPGMFAGADEVGFGVDTDRGVLLWLEQRLEGVPYRRVAMTIVAFDEELDDALFAFPDDADAPPTIRPEPRRPPATHPHDGPPDRVLGEPVGGSTVVARTDSVVVAVDRVVAYPTGFELGVTVRTHDSPVLSSDVGGRRREWSGTSAFPGESLRVGVVFADGRASVAENFTGRPPQASDVRLLPMHGSGTQARFDQRFWVEPVPPPGPVGVVVEWERRGLPETRVDLDGRAIVDAAARAETLWP